MKELSRSELNMMTDFCTCKRCRQSRLPRTEVLRHLPLGSEVAIVTPHSLAMAMLLRLIRKFCTMLLVKPLNRLAALFIGVFFAFGAMAENAPDRDKRQFVDLLRQGKVLSRSGNYLAARQAVVAQDVPSAAEFFDNAYRLEPDNNELLARAFLLRLSAGDIGRAAELADLVLKHDPSDRLSRLVLAARAFRNQRYTSAREVLRSGPANGDVDITAALMAAWAEQGSGNTDEALSSLSKLKGADWYDVFRDFHGGLINDLAAQRADTGKKGEDRKHEEARKRRSDAMERLARAYKADPYALRVMEAYARIQARAGDRDRALSALRDFQSKAPDNPIAKDLVSAILGKQPIAPMIRDVRRGAAEVLLGLGSALARDDGQDIAAIYLNLATYIDDDNALALVSLADLMDQMKRTERAVALYQRVPRNSPMRRAAELQQALALDDLERTDEALAQLNRVLEKAPSDVDALTTKGNILRVKKRFGEAAKSYSAAIAEVTDPQTRHWSLFYFRGICLEREKEWEKAELDFKRALQLHPNRPEVLNYLGYSWVDRHLNLTEALDMLHRAVELRPADGYIIDSVGWAYYRLGKYEEALKWMERAIEKKPGDPVINDHLGDVFFRLGRTLEARFQWSHARDLKPEPEDLLIINEKLRTGILPEAAETAIPAVEDASQSKRGG